MNKGEVNSNKILPDTIDKRPLIKNAALIAGFIVPLYVLFAGLQLFKQWIPQIELVTLAEYIFIIPLAAGCGIFIYAIDYPEMLAKYLDSYDFFRESEIPFLDQCRKLYAFLAASIFVAGASLGRLAFAFTYTAGGILLLSVIGFFLIFRKISYLLDKRANVPPLLDFDAPPKIINKFLRKVFLWAFVGPAFAAIILIFNSIFALQNSDWVKTPLKKQSDAYPGFINPPNWQQFWDNAYISAISVVIYTSLGVLLPPLYLKIQEIQLHNWPFFLIYFLVPLFIQMGGYLAPKAPVKILKRPEGRLAIISLGILVQIVLAVVFQPRILDVFPYTRVFFNGFIMDPQLFLATFLLLSPVLQLRAFLKSAAFNLQYLSKQKFTNIFLLYGLSVIALEIVLVMLFLISVSLKILSSFGIGLALAVLLVNLVLIPKLGRDLYKEYKKLIKMKFSRPAGDYY